MRSLSGLTYSQIAFEVCSAFQRAGVLAVLSGGGAATIHAPNAYQTKDFDFVLHLELFGMPSDRPLREIGFRPSNTKGTYNHPDIPYTLEILEGPLAVGDQTLTSWETRREGDLLLLVISATDSVKDRLAAAIHFHDLNSAKQAAEIAKICEIDLEDVKSWCEEEGGAKVFAIFETFLRTDSTP